MSARKPAGVTPEGDRLFYARVASGKTHDQLCALADGLITRGNWIGIEKGRLGTSGLKSVTGISQAFGVGVDELRAYLEGSYGPPSAEAAERFLASRKNVEFDQRVDEAVLDLAYAAPQKASAYVLAGLELKKAPPAVGRRPMSREDVKRLIRVNVGEVRAEAD